MPTESEELDNKAKADEVYQAVNDLLLRRVGDYLLVARANRYYGFRRNLYGGRTVATVLALLGILACAVGILLTHAGTWDVSIVGLTTIAAVNVFWLIGSWKVITSNFVRRAAESYARAVVTVVPLIPSEASQ